MEGEGITTSFEEWKMHFLLMLGLFIYITKS